jgi:ATP/maltotriose-dependent transcriptional regulator MalT
VLSQAYALTGQPQRGASIAREGRQEAAEQGSEFYVVLLLAMEARAWIAAGDHAAARRPAMEAVEMARRVRNPAVSALAFFAAAAAIWPGEPQTALTLIEDSLALARAGALDSLLGFALSVAAAIRIRNGDLSGALAILQEATVQQHGDGNLLGLGITLHRAAAVFARLGEAEPAAVLAGAVSAHFPFSLASIDKDEQLEIDEARDGY